MDELKFPILETIPPPPRVKPEDWMAVNEAIRRLLPLALRCKAVEENPPVPVRFTLTDDDQVQKPS